MDISSLIKTTREGERAKLSARAKSLTRSRGESPFTRSRAASLCALKDESNELQLRAAKFRLDLKSKVSDLFEYELGLN